MRNAITRALAKNKDERFASVTEFFEAFSGGAVAPASTAGDAPGAPAARRRRAAAAVAGGGQPREDRDGRARDGRRPAAGAMSLRTASDGGLRWAAAPWRERPGGGPAGPAARAGEEGRPQRSRHRARRARRAPHRSAAASLRGARQAEARAHGSTSPISTERHRERERRAASRPRRPPRTTQTPASTGTAPLGGSGRHHAVTAKTGTGTTATGTKPRRVAEARAHADPEGRSARSAQRPFSAQSAGARPRPASQAVHAGRRAR